MGLRYAYLDDAPVVFNDDKAFEFIGGRWKPMNVADAMYKARLINSLAEFYSYASALGVNVAPLPL